ncbi:MAG: ABC transporter permease [Bryobacteraceae bacterium]
MWNDIRIGIRALLRYPGFTAVAVLTLALAIGANTAIFTVVNSVLLRPLRYQEPERIAVLLDQNLRGGDPGPVSPANFADWRKQSQSFEHMAATEMWGATLTGQDPAESLNGLRVSASLFPILGVNPALGRVLREEEEEPGRHRVVVLSHGLWQRRFGGDAATVGATMRLNGEAYTVVGVMPPEFHFPPFWATQAEMWVPLAFDPERAASRGGNSLRVFARLKAGVSLRQARAEMTAIAQRLERAYPDANTGRGISVEGLHDKVVGNVRRALQVLLAAVGLVLLIACANLANLLLSRAAGRRKEIAVRIALGASRIRLVRQLLTESALLALLGGGAGLLLAVWGTPALLALLATHGGARTAMPRLQEISMDGRVLLFTLAASLLTGVLFGLAPALHAVRSAAVQSRGTSADRRSGRLRNALVSAEFALALLLLISAVLMIRSFHRLQQVDPGFRVENVLAAQVSVRGSAFAEGPAQMNLFRQLLARVEALPGVRSAALVNHLPLAGDLWGATVSIEGRPEPAPGERLAAAYRVITPDYFRTMGGTLLSGRDFTQADTDGAPPVAIVNEAMLRRYWPSLTPSDVLGKRVKLGASGSPNPWSSVVGVVKNIKQMQWAVEAYPEIYLSYFQQPWHEFGGTPGYMTVVVRAAARPENLAAALRGEVASLDRNLPVSEAATLEQVVADAVHQPRFHTLLLNLFSWLAVGLAALGLYGVLSFAVTARLKEFGIRMALGAQRANVLRLVMRQSIPPLLIGLAAGLTAAFVLTRLLSGLLYGVEATDPWTFGSVPPFLTAVAALAAWIPARRASKIDPVRALQEE